MGLGRGRWDPVLFLVFFLEPDTEPLFQQTSQSKFPESEKPGGDERVKQAVYFNTKIPMQGADIIVGPMKDFHDSGISKEIFERGKVRNRQWVE